MDLVVISQGSETVRHETIYQKALLIDKFIEYYMKAKKRERFPRKEAGQVIRLLFPNSRYAGQGASKTVYQISSRARDLALKVSREDNIRNDVSVYNQLPKNVRNRCFAKIYWNTKHCLLQKYGKSIIVPPEVIQSLKEKVKPFGLVDVRAANITRVDGKFKIVDANAR